MKDKKIIDERFLNPPGKEISPNEEFTPDAFDQEPEQNTPWGEEDEWVTNIELED